jgi:glycosyltransferase involved in cell wall biosynthesis
VVERGRTGLLVPAHAGARGLAADIGSLLDDRERRARMGRAGRERVLAKFTVRSMVEETAAVYRAAAPRVTSRRG